MSVASFPPAPCIHSGDTLNDLSEELRSGQTSRLGCANKHGAQCLPDALRRTAAACGRSVLRFCSRRWALPTGSQGLTAKSVQADLLSAQREACRRTPAEVCMVLQEPTSRGQLCSAAAAVAAAGTTLALSPAPMLARPSAGPVPLAMPRSVLLSGAPGLVSVSDGGAGVYIWAVAGLRSGL